ncbi:hypothetical protein [Evansella cellulosilytica]|uniref:Uncharacterized protein n=1 Tax=Evansella cellulosilytica (strain ATCC 21833 / DSM 2522 / FERM P-1141 / JCM 9156 / N-4) TaxID=649639 RepID=E6TR95_EVAC2|nr:hypothetical protein [Evansella cellulosilytica]ADU30607.1 hypothetical protein Bcell_2348 [Evansella cellulosilytica DSM 2522]
MNTSEEEVKRRKKKSSLNDILHDTPHPRQIESDLNGEGKNEKQRKR